MLKVYMLIISSLLFYMTSQAQVDPRKVEKAVKDPKTKEKAAKADRHVVKDKAIFDSTAGKKSCKI